MTTNANNNIFPSSDSKTIELVFLIRCKYIRVPTCKYTRIHLIPITCSHYLPDHQRYMFRYCDNHFSITLSYVHDSCESFVKRLKSYFNENSVVYEWLNLNIPHPTCRLFIADLCKIVSVFFFMLCIDINHSLSLIYYILYIRVYYLIVGHNIL